MVIGSAARLLLFLGSASATSALAQTAFTNFESPHVSPLALSPVGGGGSTLLAVNTPDARLEVFNVSNPAAPPVWVRSICVGLEPVSVRFRTSTEAWVVNHLSDSISIVDLPTGRVTRTILTGDEPADVVFAGSPARAFVSLSQLNLIAVYDPANPAAAPVNIAIAGEDPRALAVSPDGSRVYAAIFQSGNGTSVVRQQEVSLATGPYGGINPPPNSGNAFSPPLTPGLAAAPPVAHIVRKSTGGQWLDDNNRNWSALISTNLLDHDVAIIDTASLAVTYADSLMTTVMGLAVRPDGVVTAIGTESTNQVRFEPNVQSFFVRVRMGRFSPAAPAAATITDLNPHLTYTARSIPQAQRNLSIGDPRAIVWNSSGSRGFVSGMGSSTIITIDGAGARIGQATVGAGPTGIALSADESRLYVLNKFAGSISVVDTASNTETSRTAFFDPTPAVIRLGRPFMYDTHLTSGLGQAACASCHVDSRDDGLAWDIGTPAGTMKPVNQDCRQPTCDDWHPLKGPMVTQSMFGLVDSAPYHWRGDREDIAAFAPAFVGLQGRDAEPSAAEMQAMSDFVMTLRYAPNPNRNPDNTMPAAVTGSNGVGNPNTAVNIYNTLPVVGGTACVGCHGPLTGSGSIGEIDDPNLLLAPQSHEAVQLRGLYEKRGWNRTGTAPSTRGFGFQHHSEFDTLATLLQAGFGFAAGPTGIQQRRDVEALLLCFGTGTHAGVGQQVTFTGPDNTDTTLVARLNTFAAQAAAGNVGLVARSRTAAAPLGRERGWYFSSGTMVSDQTGITSTVPALRLSAAPEAEVTFTLVDLGTQRRVGADRDADGILDGDELLVCANPADPSSFPGAPGCVDVNADLTISVQDLFDFLAAYFASAGPADFNRSGSVSVQDIFDFLGAYFAGCAPA